MVSVSCLVKIFGDNSGGLFDNYFITNSLDAIEDNIGWKNIDPDTDLNIIQKSLNVKTF